MRKMIAIGSMVMAIAAAMLAFGPAVIGRDQGTPAAGASAVKKETLGKGESAAAPGRTLLLARRTFAPGADSGAHPAPGPTVLYVDAGTVDFKVVDGAATVTRAGGGGEMIAAGSDSMLQTGDAVFYDQGVVHQVVNTGSEPAVTLESRLNPVDQGAPAATPAAAAGGAAQAMAVTIKDFAFGPPSLDVAVGTTVTWTNQDSTAHTVDGDQGEFSSGHLEPGKSFSQTFGKAGTFAYHCDIHPSMKATIVVR